MTQTVYFDTNVYRLSESGGNYGLTTQDLTMLTQLSSRAKLEIAFSFGNFDEFVASYKGKHATVSALCRLARRICSSRILKGSTLIIQDELRPGTFGSAIDPFFDEHAGKPLTRVWDDLCDGPSRSAIRFLQDASVKIKALKKEYKEVISKWKTLQPFESGEPYEGSFEPFLQAQCRRGGLVENMLSVMGVPESRAQRIIGSKFSCPGTWCHLNTVLGYLYEYYVQGRAHEWSDLDDALHHAPLVPYVDAFVTLDPRFRRVLTNTKDLNSQVFDLEQFRQHFSM